MRLHLLLGATLFGLLLACAYGQEPGFNFDQIAGRLPKGVLPHAYKIELVPDLAQLSVATGQERVGFSGSCKSTSRCARGRGDHPQCQRHFVHPRDRRRRRKQGRGRPAQSDGEDRPAADAERRPPYPGDRIFRNDPDASGGTVLFHL